MVITVLSRTKGKVHSQPVEEVTRSLRGADTLSGRAGPEVRYDARYQQGP